MQDGAPAHPESGVDSTLDVVKDVNVASDTGGADDGTGDQDTCRICRGEATEQEPLFYPCKCSGSIKFVHQDCLMEWLGHSQKKHCELCKTPFRFTKLYAPNMPPTLPLHVFIHHLLIHTLKNIATWLRMCLVIIVWLGGLPWVMRHVWGLLFWFADGGWSFRDSQFGNAISTPALNSSEALALSEKLAGLAVNGTSPASPLLVQQTTSPLLRDTLTTLWDFALTQRFNMSMPEPSVAGILSSILSSMGLQEYNLPNDMINRTNSITPFEPYSLHQRTAVKHPSLLSDVKFLNTLTRNRWLNNVITTCLEGQIITIVVVICFILVFLIREWVVQQQPGINMGAGFNAEFANGGRVAADDVDLDVHDAEHGDIAAIDRIIRDVEELQGAMNRRVDELGERPVARPRRRMVRFDENRANDGLAADGANDVEGANRSLHPAGDIPVEPIEPRAPTEIDHLDATEFISLWRRADGDPEAILRLMEEEGLTERLSYWRNALRTLQRSNAASSSTGIVETNGADKIPDIKSDEYTMPGLPAHLDLLARPEKAKLLSIDPMQQKQLIGENIYPKIRIVLPELAGKVTGMLLEMDNSELLNLVDDTRALYIKMDEALLVYNAYLRDNGDNPVLSTEAGKERILEGLIIRKGKSVGIKKADKLAEMLLEMDLKDILRLVEDDSKFRPKAYEMMTLYELHLTQMRGVFAANGGKEKFLADNPDFKFHRTSGPSQVNVDRPSFPEASSSASGSDEAASNTESGRPRAVSDGVQIRANNSPLARDYWTFEDLSDAQPADQASEAAPWPGESSSQSHNADLRNQRTSAESSVGFGSPDDAYLKMQFDLAASQGERDRANDADDWVAHSESSVTTGYDEQTTVEDGPERNPFHPDGDLPEEDPLIPNQPAAGPRRVPPEGFLGHVADWLWGDMNVAADGHGIDDEHIVEDFNAEEPFVPMGNRRGGLAAEFDAIDVDDPQDVIAAVLADGDNDANDADGLDDAEDFDGIMELIGMRGPLTGLVQNTLFGAVLISLTVALGIWLPYTVGKLTLLLAANPIHTIKLPLRLVFKAAAVMQDLTLVVLGGISYALIRALSLLMRLFVNKPDSILVSTSDGAGLALDSLKFAYSAGERITSGFITTLAQIPDSEIPAFSAASHEALNHIKLILSNVVEFIKASGLFHVASAGTEAAVLPAFEYPHLHAVAANVWHSILAWLSVLPEALAKSETWVITLDGPSRSEPIDLALSYWNGTDRFWAIATGYLTFVFLGAAYVRKGSPFSSTQNGKDWEAIIIDVLNQAGGVMKVILIISIEMLVFPLYCGLLLDVATLPLFAKATLMSRMVFAVQSPFTSMFVHWFVGTCYMFHFALFVSMCRKILRTGVLYFIRDPDDPTFHPVRDVLERNVATQLRKITFSAMVYGALVLVCLGGVVWSLAFAFRGVLPITWSSNEPVLEFPIDLLFYNFLMPVAVKYFRPSDGLHAMYSWWFRKCARLLRLTWFLLDERMNDEEGYFVQWSLKDLWVRMQNKDLIGNEPPPEDQFVRNGRYVRTPASDMVRIPKDGRVFLEVNEHNERVDNTPDREEGLHGKNSKLFKMVYAPPWFRVRIFAFIVLLWLFAAVTGCSITLIPLVFGRWVFGALLPEEVKKNDIYAFSMGIIILGGIIYCLLHLRARIVDLRKSLAPNAETPGKVIRIATAISIRVLRLIYAYSAFVFVLPSLFAFLVEFYLIVPLHTYFVPDDQHTIQFVQTWTLGVLFFNLARRCILWYGDTRPAEALRAVVRKGMLDPDIRLATRCFIFPMIFCSVVALVLPLQCAWIANYFQMFGTEPITQTLVYRYSYPAAMVAFLQLSWLSLLVDLVEGWRMSIRDEVYLIGERLHNFGDSRRKNAAAAIPNMGRIKT